MEKDQPQLESNSELEKDLKAKTNQIKEKELELREREVTLKKVEIQIREKELELDNRRKEADLKLEWQYKVENFKMEHYSAKYDEEKENRKFEQQQKSQLFKYDRQVDAWQRITKGVVSIIAITVGIVFYNQEKDIGFFLIGSGLGSFGTSMANVSTKIYSGKPKEQTINK